MESHQDVITRAVLAQVRPFLGGPHPEGEGWCFEFGEHLESNWGAVYGGALAAAALDVARAAAPDRSPRSLHLQMLRPVPRGRATASATMRHHGRTVATIEVEVFDPRGKLAVIGLTTMVTPDALAVEHHHTTVLPLRTTWEPVVDHHYAPVAAALNMWRPRGGTAISEMATNARPSFDGRPARCTRVTVPWAEPELTGPEVACLTADPCVGHPLLHSLPPELLGPNPDLTLRFTTAPAGPEAIGAGTITSVQHGSVTVAIEVQSGDQRLADCLGTSLLLPAAG